MVPAAALVWEPQAERSGSTLIMLPGRKYTTRELGSIVVRRKWSVMLPLAVGLAAVPGDGIVAFVAGPAAGLLTGLALVAWHEYRNSSFSREKDVSRLLMLPVLATVPVMTSVRDRHSRAHRKASVSILGYVAVLTAGAVFFWKLLA